MENKGIKAVISAALAAFAAYFGAVAVPVIVLLIMMAAAYVTASLSSRRGISGIVKKVGYMLLIAVAMGVDYLIMNGLTAVNLRPGFEMYFGMIVTVWLIINEMISILENLGVLGVPIPGFLQAIVKKLRITTEGKER